MNTKFGPLPEPTTSELTAGANALAEEFRKESKMAEQVTVRCKMKVHEVVQVKGEKGEITQERVKLYAVTGNSPENKDWAKYTPSANFEIYIDNPAAMNKLSKGNEFYVDFTPVEPAKA